MAKKIQFPLTGSSQHTLMTTLHLSLTSQPPNLPLIPLALDNEFIFQTVSHHTCHSELLIINNLYYATGSIQNIGKHVLSLLYSFVLSHFVSLFKKKTCYINLASTLKCSILTLSACTPCS